MRFSRTLAALVVASALTVGTLNAQTPAEDPSARLKQVLPADVAERVLARIAEARARQLPAVALEQRALKFAARGVAPRDIEQSVNDHAARLASAKQAIEAGRAQRAAGEEVEAGAEALRMGVDGATVSALAKSAPSGRSLAVPLYVIGALVDRGLPASDALAQVRQRLAAQASDAELERLPAQAIAGQAKRPAQTGRELADTKRPGNAGRGAAGNVPAGVPANAGGGARPSTPTPPVAPPGGRP